MDSDPEQVVTGRRCALLSRGSSEDDGPTVRMPRRDVHVESVHGRGVRNTVRKRLRHSQASTVVAPSESVVDVLERDLSHLSHEVEDIGDVCDCTVWQSFREQLTRRVTSVPGSPSLRRPRQGVQVDSWCLWRLSMMTGWSLITDSVMGAWADDDEDPAQEDARGDHNHENPLVPEVHPVPAVIPNMVLSESAISMSDSEGPSEDVGLSEAGSFDVEESEVEPEAPFRLPGAVLRVAFLLFGVSSVEEMQGRACFMKSVPRFVRGNYRIAMRTVLEEICAGERTCEEARERGSQGCCCIAQQEEGTYRGVQT